MAVFFPALAVIKDHYAVRPTPGEWHLLKFLEAVLNDAYEIFFNPNLNHGRPDIVILRKDCGVLIIEVKDWNLKNYKLSPDKSQWFYYSASLGEWRCARSPLAQVRSYRDNLCQLNIPDLIRLKEQHQNCDPVKTCVFFSRAGSRELLQFCGSLQDGRTLLLGRDQLDGESFRSLLDRLQLTRSCPAFSAELYQNLKHLLAPRRHLCEQGQACFLTAEQSRICARTSHIPMLVKGATGSGKTLLLAHYAVKIYRELRAALLREPRILILTYNITLCNLIRRRLDEVEAEFERSSFTVINYHEFIKTQLHRVNHSRITPGDYANKALFLNYLEEGRLRREDRFECFDAVFIDEIQDYERSWMEIIRECFLREGGSYCLFGDEKQHIYSVDNLENHEICTNIGKQHSVFHLSCSCRLSSPVLDLARAYQQVFFRGRYQEDEFRQARPRQYELVRDAGIHSSVDYFEIASAAPAGCIEPVHALIRKYLNEKAPDTAPGDVAVLGCSTGLLRLLELFCRRVSGQQFTTTFETFENLTGIVMRHDPAWPCPRVPGQFAAAFAGRPAEFFALCCLFTLFPGRRADFALFLQERSPEFFQSFCAYVQEQRCTILRTMERLNALAGGSGYSTYSGREQQAVRAEIRALRKSLRYNFSRQHNRACFTTIHSFKGWESPVVILLIEKNLREQDHLRELVYTGLTRTRERLLILNLGNPRLSPELPQIIAALNRPRQVSREPGTRVLKWG